MDVALIAEPFRRPDGTIDHTADDVGEVLGEREHTLERQFLSAVLWREALERLDNLDKEPLDHWGDTDDEESEWLEAKV